MAPDRSRHQGPVDEWAADQRDRAPGTGSPARSLLDLQRDAGNEAVTRALQSRPSGAPSGPPGGPPGGHSGGAAPVVSADRHREAEADRVADAAMDRLGAGAGRLSPLDRGGISPALRGALGAVAPDVGRTGPVSVGTGEAARQATDGIGARALTEGRRIQVHPGEMGNHREANRLVAHEAVHAARHAGTMSTSGQPLVHAKMRGTKMALEYQGGGQTSGLLRRLSGKLTNWDQILLGVGAYEALEAALLKNGTPGPQDLNRARTPMLTQLAKVETACLAWQEANQSGAATREAETWHEKFKESGELQESDTRSKAARRQAVAMLLPRVRTEIADLQAGRWAQSLGLSDAQVKGKGHEASGQMNKVKELHYATENGEFSGYFKEEKGFAPQIQGHEAEVGIHQADPNYGARSVAMYRIDQLLGANVTARAEFAVHDGRLGTVLETAKGKRAADVNWALSGAHQQQLGAGSVATDDPILQRSMNKLQLLDVICGQLDRHMGNWMIETDEQGRLKGVTGIDLDMAFGSGMTTPDQRGVPDAHNYMGLPSLVDAEFGQRLLQIKESDIRAALKGLLADAEVEATVSRFSHTRDFVQQLADKGQLTHTWDRSTAGANRSTETTKNWGMKSYGHQVTAIGVEGAQNAAKAAAKSALYLGDGPAPFRPALLDQLADLPEQTRTAIRNELNYQVGSVIDAGLLKGVVPGERAVELAMELINSVLGDHHLMSRMIVAVQEFFEEMAASKAVTPVMEPEIKRTFAGLVKRYSAQPVAS